MQKLTVSHPEISDLSKTPTFHKNNFFYKAALLGNPNCGKTMLFNALTGNNQYVGNWPGVTVDQKIGKLPNNSQLIDLPGIYSLSTYTIEERVSRDLVLSKDTDIIVNIIDGTNLERNLYLTLQILEVNKPTLLIINMMDEVRKRKDDINIAKMKKILGIPIIPISAKTHENIDKIIPTMEKLAKEKPIPPKILYEQNIYHAINQIADILANEKKPHDVPLRFFASNILEEDQSCMAVLHLSEKQRLQIDHIISECEANSPYGDRTTLLAYARYQFIERLVKQTVTHKHKEKEKSISDRIDAVVTNKWLAYPIFFLVLFTIFMLTFQTIGAFFQNLLSNFFENDLSAALETLLTNMHAPIFVTELFIDGILKGVGTVVSFVPLIALLFFFLSILEDSGYMARTSFIMDKLFSKLGLSGKSFIPMIMGFGCSVPAIMAARTMPNEKDRRLTILLTPFMSCGAKLPIYGLFASAFFPKYQGYIIFSMYLIGMFTAVLSGFILSKTVFSKEKTPFIMELPPYRIPSLSSTLKLTWDKSKDFLTRAGTVIFAMSILLWFMQALNMHLQIATDNANSILATLGSVIAPLFIPLGFGTWQAAVSILSGFIAKEAVVSTMAILYIGPSMPTTILSDCIQTAFTPASAISFMVFILLCAPCMAACAAIKKEMNSLKWAFFTYIYQILTAYAISFIAYNIAQIFFR